MMEDTTTREREPETWHGLDPEEVEQRVGGSQEGLSEEEVVERRERYGANRLPAPEARGPLRSRTLSVTGVIGIRAVAVAVLVVVSLQLIFTCAPFMQFFFDSRPMAPREAGIIPGVGIVVFALLELEKAVFSRYVAYRDRSQPAH
ncbi:cation-transporting P-type ATPase [Thioalkalivibrio sp.]|uniref:cation-transporting P-type ATPase n=1 Tax=Thioalkalivibrio sp. TaxID=2093813 RepID=UPI003975F2A5